jgi:hypothetical protein
MRIPHGNRGSTLLEFMFVGIPLMFVLISIFEVARGMWTYTTVAHALKKGNRFLIVHGNNCATLPNSCSVRIRDIATHIRDSGVGLIPAELQNVQFRSLTSGRTVTCPTLDSCLQGGALGDTFWPGTGPGATPDIGGNQFALVEVSGAYRFRSALALFWPGAGSGIALGTLSLPASSRERIQY